MVVLKTGEFFGKINNFFHDENFTLSVTEYDQDDQLASEKHYHFHPNIFFILRGGVLEKCRGSCSENQTGSISFYHAGEPHQNIRELFPLKSINIEVEDSFLSKYDFTVNRLEESISINPDMKFLMLQIYREIEESDSLTPISIKMAFLSLLTKSEELTSYNQWPSWMKHIDELLHECWNETLSLEDLSRITGVHPVTISKHFSKYLGCTLGQYMRKLKVERSLSLIKRNIPLTSIAFQCGFADQSHFIRNFKQYTGLLPLEYRKIVG
jgi:AraC family transcriptional regulator